MNVASAPEISTGSLINAHNNKENRAALSDGTAKPNSRNSRATPWKKPTDAGACGNAAATRINIINPNEIGRAHV